MLPSSLCRGSSTSQQRKEQQLVMRLCKDIARAQFVFANPKRSKRLWDEAAALEIEPDRLLHLLYLFASWWLMRMWARILLVLPYHQKRSETKKGTVRARGFT